MKNVLVCFEKADIGGVETFAVTQIKELSRKGFNVFVVASSGIMVEVLKKIKNVKYFEFNYELSANIDKIKVKYINDIIIKNKIDFAYIHQYPCVQFVLEPLISNDIPYVTFNHSILEGTCDWFEEHYDIYKLLLPEYFKNAMKNIFITERTRDEIEKKYHCSHNIIMQNFVDAETYVSNNISKKTSKIMWYGRLESEKEKSIEGAYKFYKEFLSVNPDAEFTIMGDGSIKDKLRTKYSDIKFLPSTNDVIPYVDIVDIVVGVDRCILEALSMSKIAIISSYSGKLIFVNSDNIKELAKDNFSGKNQKDNYKKIFNLNDNEIESILKKNRKYVEKNLSSSNSIVVPTEKTKYSKEFIQYLDVFDAISRKYVEKTNECNELFNNNQKLNIRVEELGLENIELHKMNAVLDEENSYFKKSIFYRIKQKLKK